MKWDTYKVFIKRGFIRHTHTHISHTCILSTHACNIDKSFGHGWWLYCNWCPNATWAQVWMCVSFLNDQWKFQTCSCDIRALRSEWELWLWRRRRHSSRARGRGWLLESRAGISVAIWTLRSEDVRGGAPCDYTVTSGVMRLCQHPVRGGGWCLVTK